MKQLSFLDPQEPKSQASVYTLHVDGASRNNPGPSGAGIYITAQKKSLIKIGYFLGLRTNNQAEYLALVLGIYHAREFIKPGDALVIVSDSQLLIRQLEGAYKVKDAQLKRLYDFAKHLLMDIRYKTIHVLREENTVADEMANVGIDTKKEVPEEFINMLKRHEISW